MRYLLLPVVTCWILGCFSESLEDRLNRGIDLIYEGRYEDAESHFLTMARELARSETPGARTWQATALYQAGRIEHHYMDQPRRAVARLREALKLEPSAKFGFEARKEIAFIFYDRLKDYRTAALEFERLVQAYPDREGIAEYHYRIAQCYFLLREFSQARTEARLLLEIQKEGPIAAESMLLVANSFYVEGRYQEAATAYLDLLALNPGDEIESRSRFELGLCYQEMGDFKKAEENLLIALKLHPRPDMVRFQLASLHARMAGEDTGESLSSPTATWQGLAESQMEPKGAKIKEPFYTGGDRPPGWDGAAQSPKKPETGAQPKEQPKEKPKEQTPKATSVKETPPQPEGQPPEPAKATEKTEETTIKDSGI